MDYQGGTMNETQNLPALMSRAGTRLLEARNSAEVLEAKHLAEAALHYAKVTGAANETHADCLRIIMRAEMRMADEIDRGQSEGEVAGKGQPSNVQTADITTFDDLGIDRRRVAEWREIRNAGEDAVEEAIQSAITEGRSPTKGDIQKHVRGTFGTGDNEWFTPPEYTAMAREAMRGIDLDPASDARAQESVKAAKFFTKEDDGLSQEWNGRVWLNPPYAQPLMAQFIEKLIAEKAAGRTTSAILLTHNYSDTDWFQKAASACDAMCFPRGRIRFIAPDGTRAAPTQGQTFFYFGEKSQHFGNIFSDIGFIATVRRAF